MTNRRHSRASQALLGKSVAAALALAAASLPSYAAADWSAYGGAEAGTASSSVFLGAEGPLLSSSQSGFVHRLLLDWQEHNFRTGGVDATRRSPGAEYSLGYRISGRSGSLASYLGLQYRETDVSPSTVESETADDEWRLGFHFDGSLRLSDHWAATGQLDTYPQTRGFGVRGRLMRTFANGVSFGPEVRLEADDDQRTQQLGVVLTTPEPVSGFGIAASAGVQRGDDDDVGPYIGLEFTRHF